MAEEKIILSKDLLWKALIREVFEDFMAFFYPKFVDEIDFGKGYTFLDKELETIRPDSDQKNRRADVLVKVFLKSGVPCWLLIHVEVQGYVDKFFAKRMFQMNYRAYDKLGLEVIGFAILTDSSSSFHPKSFEYGRGESKMLYTFKTYKLLDKDPELYKKSKNPFAAVMRTAWYGLRQNKLGTDEELLTLKTKLLREFLRLKLDRKKIKVIIDFIKYYVYFEKKNYYLKFDEQLDKLTKNKKIMTMDEVILLERTRIAEEHGIEKGIERGIERGIEKTKRIGVIKMLKKGFDIEIIADILDLEDKKILIIKAELEKEG